MCVCVQHLILKVRGFSLAGGGGAGTGHLLGQCSSVHMVLLSVFYQR